MPVWISDAEFSGGYDTYCHQVLWPSLHYILPDRPKGTTRYESSSFAQYRAINERFAEEIVKVYEPGDISELPRLWCDDVLISVAQSVRSPTFTAFRYLTFWTGVNDYHLLLLPQLLRAKLPHATIGFFLHVAFPSSEIFRCLAGMYDAWCL